MERISRSIEYLVLLILIFIYFTSIWLKNLIKIKSDETKKHHSPLPRLSDVSTIKLILYPINYSISEEIRVATYEETTHYILNDNIIKELLNKSILSDAEKYDLIYRVVANYSHIKRVPKALYSTQNLPNDYISFDIETTGFSYSDKMIQIAAVKYIDKKEVDSFSTFISTDGVDIPIAISYLTGITNENLINAPSLDNAMTSFMNFIDDLPLIGHNIISFELPRIQRWANINLRDRVAIDTYEFASSSPLEIENFKLETLKLYFNIESKSHNALDDSRTTAIIFEKLRKQEFHRIIDSKTVEQIFTDKVFCYTGAFKMGRKSLEQNVTSRGGRIVKSMSSKVNYLVVAPQIAKNLTDGVKSRKELDFEDLISKNINVIKLTEDEFIEMISEE